MKRFFSLLLILGFCLVSEKVLADMPIRYAKAVNPFVHYFQIDPKQANLDVLLSAGGLTASEFRKRNHSKLTINGGFFDTDGKSLGLIIRHGQEVNPLRRNSWAVFLLGGKDLRQPFIISRDEWERNRKKYEPVQLALQVGPRLVIDRRIPTFKEATVDRRSAICITPENNIVIAMAEEALWLKDWAAWLAKRCTDALNLDGGGSSQISFHDEGLKVDVDGDTPVPNAISVSY